VLKGKVAMITKKQEWSRIINVASAHGLDGSIYEAAYVAAKHGLVGLTKVTGLGTAGTGIPANAVCPGSTKTLEQWGGTVALRALFLSAAIALLAPIVAAQDTIAPGAKVSVVFDQELPNVPGKSMRAVLVEYTPGAGSPSHRHPTSAFIYARVLEGAIRSQVNDGPERTYQTGESWTEKPGDHHQVSKNASATEPARLLAIFVVDTSDRQIVIPDK
jgi:quercetin dioxygenase-like cupin family protein